MIKNDIVNLIKPVLEAENLPVEELSVETSSFGDYSTSFPLKVGKFKTYQTPLEVAKYLVARLSINTLVSEIYVSEPGFINFKLNQKETAKYLQKINEQGKDYGKSSLNQGKKARVEFVSANPTGPLHIGNARGGPLGDSLASILKFSGYEVVKEYYNNNIGTQVDIFGDSLSYLIKKKLGDKNSRDDTKYTGVYMDELALKISQELSLTSLEKVDQSSEKIKQAGIESLFKEITEDAKEMGIIFDQTYSESEIQSKFTPAAVEQLKKKSLTKEKEGAIWFAPNDEFLDDRESVLVRSDGRYTYFADDIAYHELKFKDNPNMVVNVLGSNHHGHIPRLQAAIKALDLDVNKFKPILYQYVRVKKGNDVVKMSKRAGDFVTAKEVLDEVGKDAFRFFLLMHSANSHMDFDLDLAKKESAENPVFYVQYAHARMNSILEKAGDVKGSANTDLLDSKEEFALIKKLLQLPEIVEEVAQNFQVLKLTFYAIEIADLFHSFYEKHRVLSEDKNLTASRLVLIKAAKITLANTLNLIGVSAPEKM